jgi:hypothetical protein
LITALDSIIWNYEELKNIPNDVIESFPEFFMLSKEIIKI